MDVNAMVPQQRQHVDYTASLIMRGFLDEQFNQLQQLQDESNPDFMVEVLTLFFEDADRLLNEMTIASSHESIAFKTLDAHVHHLKRAAPAEKNQRSNILCTLGEL
ncbi:putative signal transduction histidine kinase, phosphotransfer (Hpt) domain-containing protein [Lupinus albus]|uniref:Histidine-containing phosphotransfer protein n=1 Tax=Lupinus albus TaxID=3870 RepID=A0A6A4PUH1_LUPAL|nr:putative signal transduction histidine kinase, phosphotransfer (Hpt) domain-containing protein [Lupinus albus]